MNGNDVNFGKIPHPALLAELEGLGVDLNEFSAYVCGWLAARGVMRESLYELTPAEANEALWTILPVYRGNM